MTALLDDSWLLNIRPQPTPVTAEEYDALPEEIARTIEIVDGYVAHCATPTPDHQTAGRRLANMLECHVHEAMSKGHECVTVSNSVDLRLGDQPLLSRRPDVASIGAWPMSRANGSAPSTYCSSWRSFRRGPKHRTRPTSSGSTPRPAFRTTGSSGLTVLVCRSSSAIDWTGQPCSTSTSARSRRTNRVTFPLSATRSLS